MSGSEAKHVVQAVHETFECTAVSEAWAVNEVRQSKVVTVNLREAAVDGDCCAVGGDWSQARRGADAQWVPQLHCQINCGVPIQLHQRLIYAIRPGLAHKLARYKTSITYGEDAQDFNSQIQGLRMINLELYVMSI